MRLLLFNSFFVSLIIFVALSSCKQEEPLSSVPEIEMLAYGPDTIKEFVDSVYFKIRYRDGDGDLGENDTDDHNLTVIDQRNGISYKYRIKLLVPGGADVPITGILNFSIANTFITDGSSAQNVKYTVQVTDRANNSSNQLQTSNLVITK